MVKEIRSPYPVLAILIFWQIIAYLFIFYNIYIFDILFFMKGKHCQKVTFCLVVILIR